MRRIIALFIFISIVQTSYAQTDLQTTCAASAQGQAGNMVISYTIGDMVLVDSWSENNFLLTQGVLQPQREPVNTSFDMFTADEINIYPNPVSDNVNIRFGMLYPGSLHISMYDVNGKLLLQQTFDYTGFDTHQINIDRHPNATYLLNIIFKPVTGVQKQGGYRVVKINN